MNAEPPSNSGVSRNVAVRPDEKNRMWHLEAAIESMKLGVTITDTSGIILFANATYARMHGYSPDQLVGKDAALLANTKHGRSIPKKKTERWERDAFNPYEDGSHFPVPIRSHRIETPGGQQAVVTTYEELPTPPPARVRAAGSEYRDSIAAGCAHVGLWDWDLATSSIHFSPYWKSMLGYGDSEIGNHPDEWLDRVHPSDRQRVRAELTFHFEGRVAEFRSEHRIRHADGSYRLMLTRGFAVRNVDGRATRIAGIQIEITNRRNGQPDTAAHALHDALTGLPNRDLLMERVTRAMGRADRRDDYLFALLSLNLDRFSVVNDSLGYTAGNQLLVATAERLQPGLRPMDALARTGGDEFAILLDDITDASDATRVANRIQEVLAAPSFRTT